MTYNTINDAVTMAGGEGTLLAGRYRIVRQLGQGGMGSVWLAEDTLLDNKQFAIKMLPSILVSNKRAYRQLKDEALVAMKLTHPNIVTLRAFEENNGNPFLVMDYVDGQTLDDYLAEHTGTTGVSPVANGLPESEVLRLLRPIAAALDYAHGEGVVHRDVKPANIMIRKDGHPFILDFGIAREIQETMTRVTGKLSSGTLLYMSPEQLNGEPPKPAQDVYSFAAMVYECMKGDPPFSRGNIEFQIMNKEPEPLAGRDVPIAPLAAGVMAGLAKKPEDRPSTCAAVLEGDGFSRVEHVDRVVGDGRARNPSAPQEGPRFGVAVKGVFIAALLAALAAGAWWWAATERTATNRATGTTGVSQPPPAPVTTNDTARGEAQAIELAVEAGVVKGRLQRISDDDGFRSKMNSLLDAFAKAEGYHRAKLWDKAIAGFISFTNGCEKLAILDAERNGAKASRETAVAAQTAARDADAEQFAQERWNGAATLMGKGASAFDEMQFAEAKGHFDLAAKQFDHAAAEAPKERERQIATQREAEEKAKAERERRANWRREGEQFTINEPYGLNMTMKWCPKGSFTMGSPTTEEGRYDNEGQHEVTLTKGFWMGETEVTQGQWKKIMDGETIVDLARKGLQDDTRYNIGGKQQTLREHWGMERYGDPNSRCGDIKDNIPVYYVSWTEAAEFCRRLTQRERNSGRIPEGYEYRLPTEAEWEYACRAGTTTALPNGRDIRILGENNAPALDDIAWYGGNSSVIFDGRGLDTANWKEKQYPGGRACARDVKGKRANDWGLYDMIGNVWEWCGDWYGNYPTCAASDPTGAESGACRVFRGGSGPCYARRCRSACRDGDSSGFRDFDLGFRVALAPSY